VLKIDPSPVGDGRPGQVASYASVVEPVQQAVVSVYSAKIVRQHLPPYFRQLFGDQEHENAGGGPGLRRHRVARRLHPHNNHVVEGADELKRGAARRPRVQGQGHRDRPETDVAIIKIDAQNLPTVTLADSDKLRVGDVVFAIGNPLNVGQTVTMGIVSALGRKNLHLLDDVSGYENFIQTDAPINMGNSGGALVDAKGRLVRHQQRHSCPRLAAAWASALPSRSTWPRTSCRASSRPARSHAATWGSASTRSRRSWPRPWQGVPGKEFKGMVISTITPDSPAAKAGLKQEDVIVAINDKPVDSLEVLRLIIAQTAPGTKVRVKYVRDGKPAEMEVTLTRLPDDSAAPNEFLTGVTVERVNDERAAPTGCPTTSTGWS